MNASRILAIDPGSEQSGWIVVDQEGRPEVFGKQANDEVLEMLRRDDHDGDVVVLEWTAPRGMPASAELFETIYWAGRFAEAVDNAGGARLDRLNRGDVKRHLCGTTAAKDANVRAALIDRFGGIGGKAAAVGLKASPGPLFGISNDMWAALAVAVTWIDTRATA